MPHYEKMMFLFSCIRSAVRASTDFAKPTYLTLRRKTYSRYIVALIARLVYHATDSLAVSCARGVRRHLMLKWRHSGRQLVEFQSHLFWTISLLFPSLPQ